MAVQLFGADPGEMAEAARIVADQGADLIDVNMGCWVPKVARRGGGAALLRDLGRARAVVEAVVGAVRIPVTVKVRLGWEEGQRTAVEFARAAAGCGVCAVAVHARTACQGFQGRADWGALAEVVAAVPGLPVIGNGDVTNGAEARAMFEQTGCAGVMIGRAAMGAPWIFRDAVEELRTGIRPPEPDLAERAAIALRHARLTLATSPLPTRQAVLELRGQLRRYRLDPPGSDRVARALVQVEGPAELEALLEPLSQGRGTPAPEAKGRPCLAR